MHAANYGVTRVRYNEERTHIDKVEVYWNSGDVSPSKPLIKNRSQILEAIGNGYTAATYPDGIDGAEGEQVLPYPVKGKRYLKTKPNDEERDNLGELPEF